jgi:hypothetical protein
VNTASPSATASPIPEAVPATLVIGALGLTLLDEEGDKLDTLPFTSDGADAVAFLDGAFGETPVLSFTPSDGHCSSDASEATWGDWFTLAYDVQGETPTGLDMAVTSASKTTPNGLSVLTPSGFGVGDDIAALAAAQPDAETDSYSFEQVAYMSVFYDIGSGSKAAAENGDLWWGASAAAEDGVIVTLRSPHLLRDSC